MPSDAWSQLRDEIIEKAVVRGKVDPLQRP